MQFYKKQVFLFLLLNILFFQRIESAGAPTEEIFSHIYEQGIWGRNAEGLGISGGGSLPENVTAYQWILENFIHSNAIHSIVDAGCGDWSFSKYIDWKNINYLGIDVVKQVVERNQQQFAASNITFQHGDFLKVDLPPADLLICKHVLQHLSNNDIINFLNQLGKFKHCLITNVVDPVSLSSDNQDIPFDAIYSRRTHTLDLAKPPFNLNVKATMYYRSQSDVMQIVYIQNSFDP